MTDVMISDEAGADVDGVASDNVEEGGIKDDSVTVDEAGADVDGTAAEDADEDDDAITCPSPL